MEFMTVDDRNRDEINDFIVKQWYTTDMIVRGAVIDMRKTEGIAVYDGRDIIGLLTYLVTDNVCEITSFNSLRENEGIGTELINRVIETAGQRGCKKLIVVTTNDNINAIRFYQKRGFDMARLYRNALDLSRKLKPGIPTIGENGIPLKHEIEFEMNLDN